MQPDIGSDNSGDFATTLALWVIAGCSYAMSYIVQMISMSELFTLVWTWMFNILAGVSVILAIAVNWKKGTAQIKEWFKRK